MYPTQRSQGQATCYDLSVPISTCHEREGKYENFLFCRCLSSGTTESTRKKESEGCSMWGFQGTDIRTKRVNFQIRGPNGAGKVHAEMFKDKIDKQWKFMCLIVEVKSPSPAQLML